MEQAIAFARDTGPGTRSSPSGRYEHRHGEAVNLLTTNPGELMDYINKPVGGGKAPVNPLLPLVAVPTTTGTGAESTTICVMDVLSLKVKTGIGHARLRPTLAVVDPLLTAPAGRVTAASGMDILCHAGELHGAPVHHLRAQSEQRVPYRLNPIADLYAEKSMSLLADAFRRAVKDGEDDEARTTMAMAATFAGMGFGNAGAHPARQRLSDRRPGRTSTPPATPPTSRWCRTAWRCR